MRWAAILWLAIAAVASARAQAPSWSLCVYENTARGGLFSAAHGSFTGGNFPSRDLAVMSCSSRPDDCLYHLQGGQGSDPQVCQCLASRCVDSRASCQTRCYQGGDAARKACRDACVAKWNSCGTDCIGEAGVPLQRQTPCSYKIGDATGTDPRVCACFRTQCRSGEESAACASRCVAGGAPAEEQPPGRPLSRSPAPGGGVTVLRGRK